MEKDQFVPSFLFIQEMQVFISSLKWERQLFEGTLTNLLLFPLYSQSKVLAKSVQKQLVLWKALDKMAQH